MPIMAFSQKLVKTSIDKFTNDTISSTSQEKIASTEKFSSTVANILYANAGRINSHVLLNLEINVTTADNSFFIVSAGDSTLLKLADDTFVKLFNIKDVPAVGQSIKKGFVEREYWTAQMSYLISKKDIERILSSSVNIIRVGVRDKNFDFDVNSKDSDVIKKMLVLVSKGK